MKNCYKKITALGLSLSYLTLSSCSNMTDNQRVELEATSISTLGGAAVGAALGLAAGEAIGSAGGMDKGKARLWGLIIGGAIGMFQGYQFGQAWTKSIIRKKEAYASNEAYLNANIDQLEYRNKETVAQINMIQKMMNEINGRKRSKFSKKQALAIQKYANTGVKLIDEDITTAKKAQAANANPKEAAKLKAEIDNLSKQRNALQTQANRIVSSSYCV